MKTRPRWFRPLGLLAAALFTIPASRAATVASDNAGNYDTTSYNSDANHPLNLGTGFGMWSLGATGSNRGTFLSTGNNGNSANINTSGNAFDIFAYNSSTLGVTRAFTADTVTNSANLAVGQTLSLSFNNLGIDPGQSVGISLGTRFTFNFIGGQQDYTYTDSLGAGQDSLIAYTNGGLTFAFTLTGTNTYKLVLNTLADQQTNTITGTLAGTAGTGINAVTVFDNNAGTGNDLLFNSLAITGTPKAVPEPAAWASLMLGTLALLAGQRIAFRQRRAPGPTPI